MNSKAVRWILTAAASAGVVGTGIAAAKGGMKTAKKNLSGMNTKSKIAEVAPDYIWAGLLGLSTIACIVSANIISDHVQNALTSALLIAERAYLKQQEKYEWASTQEQHDAVRKSQLEDIYDIGVPKLRKDEVLCYDPNREFTESGGYFGCTMEELWKATYLINRDLAVNGDAPLSDFYKYIGINPTAVSEEVGWSYGAGVVYGYEWINLCWEKWTLDDGLEVHVLQFDGPPTADYLSY